MNYYIIDSKKITFSEVIKLNDYDIIKKLIIQIKTEDKNYEKLLQKIIVDNRIDMFDYIKDTTKKNLYYGINSHEVIELIAKTERKYNLENNNFFEQYATKYIESNESNPVMKFHMIAALLEKSLSLGVMNGIEALIDNYKSYSIHNQAANGLGMQQILRYIMTSPHYSSEEKLKLFKNTKEKYNINLNANIYMSYQNYMIVACEQKEKDLVQYLLSQDIVYPKGSAIELTIKKNSPEIFDILNKSNLNNLQKYKYLLLAAKNNALDSFKNIEEKGGDIGHEEIVRAAFKTKKSRKIQNYLLEKLSVNQLKPALESCHESMKPILLNHILENDLTENITSNRKTKKI